MHGLQKLRIQPVRGALMRCPSWHRISVRKPLAVMSFFWTMGLCTVAYFMGRDIPPGIQSILIAVAPTCIGSYVLSSAYESVRTPREDEKKDG
jgi:hypothetical protein